MRAEPGNTDSTLKKAAIFIGFVLAGLLILFLMGPRVEIDLELDPIGLSNDLDEYLHKSEATFSDIVPGCEKKIIWAHSSKTKTKASIVYLHGFSASRQETAPLCDELAEELEANLFYSRLTGHGRTGQALSEATVNDWINDANEALEIAKQLGDTVIIIGSSTGGTLATWLAAQPTTSDNVIFILLSPNFSPRDSSSELLTWPWAEYFVPLFIGDEHSFEPANDKQGLYWTQRYPSAALFPMMGLVKHVRSLSFESINNPIQIIYSPNDKVVDTEETEYRFGQFGSIDKNIIPINHNVNKGNHVLAGDILAPNNTQEIKDIILSYIQKTDKSLSSPE